jgi:hypothetical protein
VTAGDFGTLGTAASVLTQSIARLVALAFIYADDDQPVDVTVKPRVLSRLLCRPWG